MTAMDYFNRHSKALLYEHKNPQRLSEISVKAKLMQAFLDEAKVGVEARAGRSVDDQRSVLLFQNEKWNVLVRIFERRYPEYSDYPVVYNEFLVAAQNTWPNLFVHETK
jgi:hypothetical protein